MPDRRDPPTLDDDARQELEALRAQRRRRVEQMLHDDVRRQAPANAIYWIAVVGGAFLLNLGLMLVLAR